MDIESEVYYKDNNGEVIGANVLIYNDTEDIVEKIVIVEDKCFQNLKDKIDNLNSVYLSKEDLIEILANTKEDVAINATTLSNLKSSDVALREHTHTEYAPKYHVGTTEKYGLGSTNEYGHCKTRDNLTAQAYVKGEALSAYQGQLLNNRLSTIESSSSQLQEAYTKNSMRIKIGRWSDNAGENGTKIEVNYKSDGIYAKLYCDKSDFNYTDKEVVLVINGIPYIRKINKNGKSERLGILLERGTYVLTAFIRGYEGLNPATDMKIIKVI